MCLLKLDIGSQSTGLYGRTVLVLQPRKHLGFSSLPSNSFGPGELADFRSRILFLCIPGLLSFFKFKMTSATGDIVGLYDTSRCAADSQVGTGIVTRVCQASVSVAFDDTKDGVSFDTDAVYNLLKLANDVTYKRMKKSVTSYKYCL